MEYLLIAGTAMSAIGSIVQGQQQSDVLNAAAKSNVLNAAAIRAASNQREEQQRRVNRTQIGKMRAVGAQAGIGQGGSLADATEQSAVLMELDALNIRYEGELNATGALQQAEFDKANAKNAKTNGYIGAVGALMRGAAGYMGYGGMTQSPAPVSDATIKLVG